MQFAYTNLDGPQKERYLFFFNLLQKERGTQKEGVPSEKVGGNSNSGGNCADMFGPFLLNNGHKQRKYYDATFICMSSRAIHVETTNSMSTDSFTLALRRLISWRGNVWMIHTGNGTNFVGENIELRKAFAEMKHTKINNFLIEFGEEWISWRWNRL